MERKAGMLEESGGRMIDLSYHKKEEPKGWEPEEIACAVVAMMI